MASTKRNHVDEAHVGPHGLMAKAPLLMPRVAGA